MNPLTQSFITATDQLSQQLSSLTFPPPVALTYNPLTYARNGYVEYLVRYAQSPKTAFFLGMNPGPFGMAQTGVPFGEIPAVKNWLGIQVPIQHPTQEHPKRPIQGFDCPRSEVSGRRLWGLFAQEFGTAENFFKHHFVANYCPLIWMSETGANITPDKLPKSCMQPVEEACLDYLETSIRLLTPKYLIGIGAYATKKLELVSKRFPDKKFIIGTLLHPSPASPISNKFWPERPIQQLKDLKLL